MKIQRTYRGRRGRRYYKKVSRTRATATQEGGRGMGNKERAFSLTFDGEPSESVKKPECKKRDVKRKRFGQPARYHRGNRLKKTHD